MNNPRPILYRPPTGAPPPEMKTCQFIVGWTFATDEKTKMDLLCWKEFLGGPRRKYCDEHSKSAQYRGKA